MLSLLSIGCNKAGVSTNPVVDGSNSTIGHSVSSNIGTPIIAGYVAGMISKPGMVDSVCQSGFNTIILWCIHVAQDGSLSYNNDLIVKNGVFVGNVNFWGQIVNRLKSNPSSVNKVILSIGSGGTNDFFNIYNLVLNHATDDTSGFYKNCQALLQVIKPDAIDFDDEDWTNSLNAKYFVPFTLMLSKIQPTAKITFCPFNSGSFWKELYRLLEIDHPNLVTEVYLQCYGFASRNSPWSWELSFPNIPIYPGLACLIPSIADGKNPAQMKKKFQEFIVESPAINGGFLWLVDDIIKYQSDYGYSIKDYTDAMKAAFEGK